MSNTGIIIEERSRDIGGFLVGRLLPFRNKRMVGPFTFIDHMGPSEVGPEKYLDVDQHPHIGLSTLTYLLEGEIDHKDSLGTEQTIKPGSVNWMTAGKGVVHTERTPKELRGGLVSTMHGYQIWIALPKDQEEIEPSFHHISADDLPSWNEGSAEFKLVAGEAFGKKSPVPVYSPLFMVEIKNKEAFQFNSKDNLKGEIGVCIVNGAVEVCGERVEKGNLLVSKEDDICEIHMESNSHIFLFGGQAFDEERFIYWNFVSSSRDKIEAAKKRWEAKEFPQVQGDSTYVPLPSR